MKFKPRVRAKADVPLPEPRPRRNWLLPVGAGAWLVTALVCLAVSEPRLRFWEQSTDKNDDDEQSRLVARSREVGARRAAGASGSVAPVGARWPTLQPQAPRLGQDSYRPLAPRIEDRTQRDRPGGDAESQRLVTRSGGAAASASAAPTEPAATCEGAIAALRRQVVAAGKPGPAKLVFGRHRAQIENGSYLRGCSLPEDLKLRVCAAIQHGRAVGVTVHTSPLDRRVQDCVRRAIRDLQFEPGPELDVTRAEFSAP